MKEVVISVDHPLIVHKDNGLLANVVGTPLAKMGSAAEMISHLPFVNGRGRGIHGSGTRGPCYLHQWP